jgi:hypothetical protein
MQRRQLFWVNKKKLEDEDTCRIRDRNKGKNEHTKDRNMQICSQIKRKID